jgi:hypothetical protein
MRQADVTRKTRETEISVAVDLDTDETIIIDTGLPFLDHMLESCARHGRFSLTVKAAGDLEIASVPVEVIPRNAVTIVEEAVGKFIKTDLVQGEMLLTHNLADPTNKVKDLSFILADDHVLFAFQPGDLLTSEDLVQRGDIVDIFATITQEIKPEEDEIDPETGEPVEPETREFTLDTFQRVDITALIVDVVQQVEGGGDLLPGQTAEGDPTREVDVRAYLLALNPQDALILKHLTDTGAIFDIVLRAPTSTIPFELTPVTEEFINEFYGLEILP